MRTRMIGPVGRAAPVLGIGCALVLLVSSAEAALRWTDPQSLTGLPNAENNDSDPMDHAVDRENVVWVGGSGNNDLFWFDGQSAVNLSDQLGHGEQQDAPDVGGDFIGWGNGNEGLYQISAGAFNSINETVNGIDIGASHAAWLTPAGNNTDNVSAYELSSGAVTNLTPGSNVARAAVSAGDGFVAFSDRGVNGGAIRHDMAGGTSTNLSDLAGNQGDTTAFTTVAADGAVAWQNSEFGTGREGVYVSDGTAAGTEQLDPAGTDPVIDGDLVAWHADDGTGDTEIFLHDLTADQTTQITDNGVDDGPPSLSDGNLAWLSDGTIQSYLSDLQQILTVDTGSTPRFDPLISGDFLAWQQHTTSSTFSDRELLLSKLVPSPAGLPLLGLAAMALAWHRRPRLRRDG